MLTVAQPAASVAESPRLRLTVGISGPVEEVAEAGKGIGIRVEHGKSPLLGLGVAWRLGKRITGFLDTAIAPMHPYAFNACFFNGSTGRCDFPVTPETADAQTYKYVLGMELGTRDRRANPYLGADLGGITYSYFAFDNRRRDTRLLWSLRGGVVLRAGRHGLVIEARRSTVSNPPWGLEAFHPFEIRGGVELAFDR